MSPDWWDGQKVGRREEEEREGGVGGRVGGSVGW